MKCVRTVCNQDFSPLPRLVRTSLVPGKYVGTTDNSPKIHFDNDGFVVQFHFYNMYLTIGNDSLTNWHVYVNDGFIDIKKDEYTVKMTTAQVVETSVTVNNSPIQDYVHPDDHTQPTYKMICQGN